MARGDVDNLYDVTHISRNVENITNKKKKQNYFVVSNIVKCTKHSHKTISVFHLIYFVKQKLCWLI